MPALTLHHPHPWALAPAEAIALQQSMRSYVQAEPLDLAAVRSVAGVDVGFPRPDTARAAIVVLAFPSLQPVEQVAVETPLAFPYIPGLLSFREIPAILAALEKLSFLPDVIMVDGQGLAHPRRFGLACHAGVLLNLPSLGCAKSILVGKHTSLAEERGSVTELMDGEEVLGRVLRTRQSVKPVYISIGHRMDLESATKLALECSRGYRLPEPTRLADQLASLRGSRRT